MRALATLLSCVGTVILLKDNPTQLRSSFSSSSFLVFTQLLFFSSFSICLFSLLFLFSFFSPPYSLYHSFSHSLSLSNTLIHSLISTVISDSSVFISSPSPPCWKGSSVFMMWLCVLWLCVSDFSGGLELSVRTWIHHPCMSSSLLIEVRVFSESLLTGLKKHCAENSFHFPRASAWCHLLTAYSYGSKIAITSRRLNSVFVFFFFFGSFFFLISRSYKQYLPCEALRSWSFPELGSIVWNGTEASLMISTK